MRIFSPLTEVDFAGHPIIATAFVLAESGEIALKDGITSFELEQNIGTIEVNVSSEMVKRVLFSSLAKCHQ